MDADAAKGSVASSPAQFMVAMNAQLPLIPTRYFQTHTFALVPPPAPPPAALTAPALARIPGAQLAIEKVAPSELGMSTWACPCLPCRPCLAICPCN
jgi:hypothetical protein